MSRTVMAGPTPSSQVREPAGQGNKRRTGMEGPWVTGVALAVAWRGPCRVAVLTVARGRRRTRVGERDGLGKCRAAATCVRDRQPCEGPGGRHRSRNAPVCPATGWAVHSNLAGRTKQWEKNFCCVTTRCRNYGWLWCLGRRGGALTALPLGLSVLGFDGFILASFGLSLGRLPATDLTQAFGVLAITRRR